MTYLGIDLAWSSRARTGLAAVGDDGALLDGTSVVTDADIDAWVDRWPAVQVAAIDAPLIVPNLTGQRPAEKLITKDFGRFHAGAHSANRSMSYFDPPRGEALAQRHGWHLDPAVPGRPLALEVYPHPAMIGLLRLGRVLPYKGKRGRTLETRKTAYRDLFGHLERISALQLAQNADWREVRRQVEVAARPSDLDRIEDAVDAILCAHLAWLWDRRPGALVLYGDTQHGYIAAPAAPDWPASRGSVAVNPVPPEDDAALVASCFVPGLPTSVGRHPGDEAQRWASAVAAAAHTELRLSRVMAVELDFILPTGSATAGTEPLDGLMSVTLEALLKGMGLSHARGQVARLEARTRRAQPGEGPGVLIFVQDS